MLQRKTMAVMVAAALALGANAAMAQWSGGNIGPSTTQTPYLNTSDGGYASFKSILSASDVVPKTGGGSYAMAGIPDGLGAFDNGNGTITVLMSHEIPFPGSNTGAVRDHGSSGAFVSQWIIDKSTLQVLSGKDAIQAVNAYNYTTQNFFVATPGTADTTFSRFCSSDLAAATAFYNSTTGLGYNGGRIFMNGEEAGASGRAYATVVSGADAGNAYQLAALGRYSFENAVANPYMQNKTIVASTDDTSGNGNGKVYIYVGTKTNSGNAIQQAGLDNGQKYVIAVTGQTQENRTTAVGGANTFTLAALPDQHTVQTNTNAQATAAGGTSFLRPEDIAWDPKNPNKLYFVTTDQYDQAKDGVGATVGRSRVWRMTFTDLSNPQLGGSVELLVDGTGPGQMFDNLTVDMEGNLILQEDLGANAHNGKVWKFDTASNSLFLIGSHDVARFGKLGVPATGPFNNDEESSGVIDVTDLFAGVAGYNTSLFRYYMLDTQAHYAIAGAAFEGGQLQLMAVPVPEPATYAMMGAGLGLLAFAARRRKQKGSKQ